MAKITVELCDPRAGAPIIVRLDGPVRDEVWHDGRRYTYSHAVNSGRFRYTRERDTRD